jgi:hypothetical protein
MTEVIVARADKSWKDGRGTVPNYRFGCGTGRRTSAAGLSSRRLS